MKKTDRFLVIFLLVGVWGLLGYYFTLSKTATSQDFYYEVQYAINECSVNGRVREDFYGAHRLQAQIDCGPTFIGDN